MQALSYHPPMEVYVLGTSRKIDFKLPDDDDFHHEWKGEGMILCLSALLPVQGGDLRWLQDITFRPQIDQSFVRILSPVTWTTVDT